MARPSAVIRLVVVVLAGGLVLGGVTSRARGAAQTKRFNPAARAAVDRIAEVGIVNGITGITVGISDPSLGYLVKSYGTADPTGARLTPNMHYRIASVTKTFTADAVLHLVQQGKVSLNAPISRYASGIPRGRRITIRDLLAMRGGVYDFTGNQAFNHGYASNPKLPGWTPNEAVKIIRDNPGRAKNPNKQTVYSNSEYVLLGYVIQKASGESAQRYIGSLIR